MFFKAIKLPEQRKKDYGLFSFQRLPLCYHPQNLQVLGQQEKDSSNATTPNCLNQVWSKLVLTYEV